MSLPNIKKLFVPDPGYTLFDVDLDRADLQVVVWEADDADLKRQLRLGVDIHIMNGILLDGIEPPPEDELIETHPEYPEHKGRYKRQLQLAKAFCHGTNYGGKARTMARVTGKTVRETELLQARWFHLHPGIKQWHDRTMHQLETRRYVENRFGYRRFYFDRIENLLPEALAWVPQSTVAIITSTGIANLDANIPECQVLLQVHDSVVFQLPTVLRRPLLPKCREQLLIEVPYDDPLIIPVGAQMSTQSWGHCEPVAWDAA
jgi:DNA polymerase I-like protein with 3'-5' exonuclease and polymerase domains